MSGSDERTERGGDIQLEPPVSFYLDAAGSPKFGPPPKKDPKFHGYAVAAIGVPALERAYLAAILPRGG